MRSYRSRKYQAMPAREYTQFINRRLLALRSLGRTVPCVTLRKRLAASRCEIEWWLDRRRISLLTNGQIQF
jgi:hypothetical protein